MAWALLLIAIIGNIMTSINNLGWVKKIDGRLYCCPYQTRRFVRAIRGVRPWVSF